MTAGSVVSGEFIRRQLRINLPEIEKAQGRIALLKSVMPESEPSEVEV
jgi:hypothetical protein